jgi:hypothetical protein
MINKGFGRSGMGSPVSSGIKQVTFVEVEVSEEQKVGRAAADDDVNTTTTTTTTT